VVEPSPVSPRVTSTGGGPTEARAERAGGRFAADPIDGGWRVNVMIPT
jgi:hypothetical protein